MLCKHKKAKVLNPKRENHAGICIAGLNSFPTLEYIAHLMRLKSTSRGPRSAKSQNISESLLTEGHRSECLKCVPAVDRQKIPSGGGSLSGQNRLIDRKDALWRQPIVTAQVVSHIDRAYKICFAIHEYWRWWFQSRMCLGWPPIKLNVQLRVRCMHSLFFQSSLQSTSVSADGNSKEQDEKTKTAPMCFDVHGGRLKLISCWVAKLGGLLRTLGPGHGASGWWARLAVI